MAWQDDNNPKKPQSPWDRKPEDQGPPDIEAIFKKLFGFLGGKKKPRAVGGTEHDGNGGDDAVSLLKAVGFVVTVIVVIWALSGIYIVAPAERAVLLKFGKYEKTVQPGPHWFARFVQTKYVVNVNQRMTVDLKSEMLTAKENIVSVAFVVQYRVSDIKNYLFNVINPINSLQQVVDSAVRQVIGRSTLDEIITTGRAKVANEVQIEIDALLKKYKPGLMVTAVTMQPAKAPEAVKPAFDDVIKAREDQVRIANEATSYANKIVPVAKGQSSRILQEAQAYQQQVVFQAKGAVSQFLAILPRYEAAPNVTAERMYLSTMQRVLSESHLVVATKGNHLFYVPGAKMAAPESMAHSAQVSDSGLPSSTTSQGGSPASINAAYMRMKEAGQ
jgi:membrane protease subunit HflK